MNEKQIVKDNIKLVYFVLKKLNLYKEIDDLYDIGLIGLCKAANSFDEKKGYTFSTYATFCIRNEILMYRRKRTNKVNINAISLNTPIYENGESEIVLEDTLKSDEDIEKTILDKEQNILLYESIEKLDEKEKLIICHYYGLLGYGNISRDQLSKDLGISLSYISRIKNRALKKLKRMMEDL